jgi:hypothetical protein
MNRINRYTRAARVYYNLNRWVCVRIDVISGLFAAGLGAYLVYLKSTSPSNVGFSLNMASACNSLPLIDHVPYLIVSRIQCFASMVDPLFQ